MCALGEFHSYTSHWSPSAKGSPGRREEILPLWGFCSFLPSPCSFSTCVSPSWLRNWSWGSKNLQAKDQNRPKKLHGHRKISGVGWREESGAVLGACPQGNVNEGGWAHQGRGTSFQPNTQRKWRNLWAFLQCRTQRALKCCPSPTHLSLPFPLSCVTPPGWALQEPQLPVPVC